MNFSKIAILGPGLLGGSIALSLRKKTPSVEVAIWGRSEAALAEIRAAQIAQTVSNDLAPVVSAAELIILCMPIGAMPAVAEKIVTLIPARALVTDVGSVKSSVVAALAPIFKERGRFLGSHPMAGSEQTGFAAARADLFENAMCILTPSASDEAAVAELSEFWKSLGCRVAELSPEEHDRLVAHVSHLPHLLAATLVELAAGCHPQALDFCGPGFRDMTRIAAGAPAMWAEILHVNRGPVVKSINAMIEKMRDASKLFDAEDAPAIEQFLIAAKQRREALKTDLK
ncbi:MAG: hypothetical protein QOD99_3158 [Chthoniobacter sp.]|jgi:prephenate dehydrogenase|nr:hypothetical protein [Chthoniobacter sp.]